MCLDQKNWTTYCSANQKELKWKASTNYNLQFLHVAHTAIKSGLWSTIITWKFVIKFPIDLPATGHGILNHQKS